jgi:hypothetical protein
MRYSDWIPLDKIVENTPAKPGLFQVRVREGLLTYPQGRSAMFYYGYARNLRSGLTKFRNDVLPLLEANEKALFVRWMPAEDVEERFQNYLNYFLTNFGTMPLGNEMLLRQRSKQITPSQ